MDKSNKTIIGFKCFNSDLSCRGFQFEVGKTYTHDGDIRLCYSGFHFHHNFEDRFAYYARSGATRICEIEATDYISEGNKSVAKTIKIIRELTWREILLNGNGDGDGNGNGDGNGIGDGYGYGDGDGVPEIVCAD